MKSNLIYHMMEYYRHDARRINHFIKVLGFATTLGELESLEPEQREILEITAILHDIGIKNSELKYNSSAGYYQELEGPIEARKLLEDFQFDPIKTERICFMIGHHHTYHAIDDLTFQILVEADFLVNVIEDELSLDGIKACDKNIFKTFWGRALLRDLVDGLDPLD